MYRQCVKVPHFVLPGETLPCHDYQVHPGGKGLNQSLALAKAGAQVAHAGKVGEDGRWLKDLLEQAGVDVSRVQVVDSPSGHALIQVNQAGENAIVLFGGANRQIELEDIEPAMSGLNKGDFLLLQNEISHLTEIMQTAAEREVRIVFNAAPITDAVHSYPLDLIDTFILNEVEAEDISGESDSHKVVDKLLTEFPNSRIVLTLGEGGALFADSDQRITQPAYKVSPVDTTGAGDTFTGYFLAGYSAGHPVEQCLDSASRAAAICVTREGAATSIPSSDEVASFQ